MKDTPAVPLEVAGVIIGEVVSTNYSQKELTIKEDNTQTHRTLSAMNPDILRSLKKGDRVRISIPEVNQVGTTVYKS